MPEFAETRSLRRVLKRGDEGDLVLQAHHNPRFVEDVVREVTDDPTYVNLNLASTKS